MNSQAIDVGLLLRGTVELLREEANFCLPQMSVCGPSTDLERWREGEGSREGEREGRGGGRE